MVPLVCNRLIGSVIKAIANGNATQHLAATVAIPGVHRDAPAPEEAKAE